MCKINPKVDIVFKKLFGSEENKDLLLSLINAILPQEEQVVDILLKNPYNLPDYMSGKLSILDIKATDEDGKIYDVEMQTSYEGFFGQRALYYWGKSYTEQIEESGMYSTLKKTIVISILDFRYLPDDKRFHRAIQALDRDTKELYEEMDYLEMHFIELPKFQKELPEIHTALDRWVTFLTRAYELEKGKIPEELASMPEVKKAVECLDTFYLSKEEQELYEAEKKKMLDEKSKEETLKELKEDLVSTKEDLVSTKEDLVSTKEDLVNAKEDLVNAKEDLVNAKKNRDLEIAQTGKKNGIPYETISLMTGLSIEDIEKL